MSILEFHVKQEIPEASPMENPLSASKVRFISTIRRFTSSTTRPMGISSVREGKSMGKGKRPLICDSCDAFKISSVQNMLFFIDQNCPKPTPSDKGIFTTFQGLDQFFLFLLESKCHRSSMRPPKRGSPVCPDSASGRSVAGLRGMHSRITFKICLP